MQGLVQTWCRSTIGMLHLRLGTLLPDLVDSLKVRVRVWVVQTLCGISLVQASNELRKLLGSFSTKITLYGPQVLDTWLSVGQCLVIVS